jgi:FkbM family methyltransferase
VAYSEGDTFQRALSALQAGSIQDAEHLFKSVLREQPRHIAALNLLGIVLIQLRRFADAETYLRLALEENAKSDATLHNYAIVLRALNRPTEALERFTQALAINSAAADTWYNRGTVFSDLGRHEEAVEDFEKAIELNPRYADALCSKGKSLAILKRFEEAFSAFEGALTFNPGLAEAWYCRGNLCGELKRYGEAVAAYDKALAQQPNYAEAWLGVGSAFFELAQYDKASDAFENALKLGPDLAEAWFGRGKVFAVRERYDDAVAALDKALALRPDLNAAWLYRRYVLAALKHYDKDDPACNLRIIEFVPRDGSPLAVHIQGEPLGRTVKLVADRVMGPIVLDRHRWQVEELEFAKRVCTGAEPITLVDVGANMGLFSRQLLAALPTIVEVFAYEPEPQNFACTVHNLEPFRGRVTTIEAALSNESGQMEFYLDPLNSGNFSLIPDAMPQIHFKTTVETRDIAVECAAWMNGGRRIFYKSDTEGFDESIVTAILPEVWPRIFAGFIEIWRIKKPPFDTALLASILDSFPNKIFLANADTHVSETPVSTTDVLNYIKVHDGAHVDLGFWR